MRLVQARGVSTLAADQGLSMAMTADDVLDLIAEEAPVERDALDPAATLESLGVASLDMISVLFSLEDRFGLVVETEEIGDAKTLGDFLQIVLAKAAAEGK